MIELVAQVVLHLLPPVDLQGRRQRPLPLPARLRDLGQRAEEEPEGRGERGQQREQGLRAGRRKRAQSEISGKGRGCVSGALSIPHWENGNHADHFLLPEFQQN